jgi:predicted kinase
LIDTDELDRIYPVPDDLSALSERNLAAVWRGFQERGSTRLILVGVFADRPTETEWIARAVPGARFTLIRLVAPWATLAERIRKREVGTGLAAQLERTASQVAAMQTDQRGELHVVDTGGLSLEQAAGEVRRLWMGSL